ncbi:MAG TPA: hypothetical protein ENJ12_11310 [Thiolapillus brandeum]|uniref:Sodium/calcium exchanger membrane region domain-containing protein n=2 Tax=Thiolapillus TaxID=1608298 RepID=A0A831RZ48_9GAMM|nr:hypothetical protein [Thiolapillus brandeum]
MSQDNPDNKHWLWLLIAGFVLVAAGQFLVDVEGWLKAALLGVGGLMIVFASSEMMIKAVDGYAKRKKMNSFVAGTMAGLSSNIPEMVMLAFVLMATPRVGFIVTVLTLHVGAAAFGLYCGLLPRDVEGNASLPKPLVGLSTDLYAAAAGVFFSLGVIMLLMKAFAVRGGGVASLNTTDLYVFGVILLAIQVVATSRLIKRFSAEHKPESAEDIPVETIEHERLMPVSAIASFGLAGLFVSVIGGHSVGEFADILVHQLEAAGYSEMFGAIILSLFSAAGAFIMIGTAHFQKKYSIAMANASGAITQVPFLVLPIAMILLAVFTQTGIIPALDGGSGVIPIDIHTTSAILLGFPSMLVLWKAVQDDGKVNWVETSTMVAIFLLVIYLLVAHG